MTRYLLSWVKISSEVRTSLSPKLLFGFMERSDLDLPWFWNWCHLKAKVFIISKRQWIKYVGKMFRFVTADIEPCSHEKYYNECHVLQLSAVILNRQETHSNTATTWNIYIRKAKYWGQSLAFYLST